MNLRNLKQEIKKKVLQGYELRTNFSSNEFLVEIGNLIIIAKIICTDTEVKYEFALDTQFVSDKEISYKEIVMIKDVIDLLNQNKKLALSRLKKWTVEEYREDERIRKIRSEKMLEELKSIFLNRTNYQELE